MIGNDLSPDAVRAAFDRPSYVDVEGGRLAHYRFGRGPDVVLVHGWPLSAITFRAIVPHLARSFTLHLVDLPGCGLSADWRGPIDVAHDARALRDLVDRLGLSRYALLAHDSGGAIARIAAAGDPRVVALVLGNTEIPGHHAPVVEALALAARVGAAPLLLSMLRVGFVRRSAIGFGGCFRDPAFVDGEFADVVLRRSFGSRAAAAGQIAFLRALDGAGVDRLLRDAHARLTAPALLVWGTGDPFFPLAKARAMLPELAGGGELVEIPGAKLFAHEDHPEIFAGHTARFLARAVAPHADGGAARVWRGDDVGPPTATAESD